MLSARALALGANDADHLLHVVDLTLNGKSVAGDLVAQPDVVGIAIARCAERQGEVGE